MGVEDRLRGLLRDGRYGEAVALLHAEYGRDVARYVERRLPSPLAEDVCQETWAAAQQAIARFRLECHPRVWLRLLARNKLVDAQRRRRPAETLDSDVAALSEVAGLFVARAPTSPTRRLAREDRRRALAAALAPLDPEDREILTLRYVDDLKPAEIALVLGPHVRPNTVSQRLVRLVRRVRAALEGTEA